MVKYEQSIKEQISHLKLAVIHKIYIFTYLTILIGSTISIAFSTWNFSEKLQMMLVAVSVCFVMILFIALNKKFIKEINQRYNMYLLITIVFFVMQSIFTRDKSITTLGPLLGTFILIVFMSFIRQHIYIFAAIVSGVIIYFFIDNPVPTVELGIGYYVNYIIAIIVFVYTAILGIKLFKEYETKLYKEIRNVSDQNLELTAINEEYMAAEEELHAQYDEISVLHKESQLLLEQLDAIVNATEDGVVEYDISTATFKASAKAMMHLVKNEVSIDNPSTGLIHHMNDGDAADFKKIWHNIVSGVTRQDQIEVGYNVDNKEAFFRFIFLKYTSKYDGNECVILIVKDITNEKEQERHIFNVAYYDTLSGLMSRTGFCESLDAYIDEGFKNFHLLLLDIDNFKYINDTFGYEVGDAMLKMVASGLKAYGDQFKFISRIGSDDFGFVIDGSVDPELIINDINYNKRQFVYEDTEFSINYSIGIARYSEGLWANDLIKNAEIAMYLTKEKGKNGYQFYDKSYGKEVHKRLLMTNALEKAIQRGEIYLVFQPKYKASNKKIIGFEALARWKSEQFGFIAPNEFITLAEQTGFISILGHYIAEQACHFANRINSGEGDYIVSINISGKQLLHCDFFEDFKDIIERTHTDVHNIGIEVTETAFMENIEVAENIMKRLKDLGLKIYLDDFGTGYSSLNYLSRLPIDILKIDKSFVDHIHTDNNDLQMVCTIIDLGKRFGLDIVAEGVEYVEQYDLLLENGCDIIQGYYFDRPLDIQDALERVNR